MLCACILSLDYKCCFTDFIDITVNVDRIGYGTQCAHAGSGASVMSDSATPWTVTHQAPLSMGILQTRILEWIAMPSLVGIFPTQRSNPRLLCLLHWQHITLFNFLHSFLLSCEVMFASIFSSSSFFFFSPITYKPPDNRDLSWSINSSDTRWSRNPRCLYHTGEGDANQQPLKLDWCHVFK